MNEHASPRIHFNYYMQLSLLTIEALGGRSAASRTHSGVTWWHPWMNMCQWTNTITKINLSSHNKLLPNNPCPCGVAPKLHPFGMRIISMYLMYLRHLWMHLMFHTLYTIKPPPLSLLDLNTPHIIVPLFSLIFVPFQLFSFWGHTCPCTCFISWPTTIQNILAFWFNQ